MSHDVFFIFFSQQLEMMQAILMHGVKAWFLFTQDAEHLATEERKFLSLV